MSDNHLDQAGARRAFGALGARRACPPSQPSQPSQSSQPSRSSLAGSSGRRWRVSLVGVLLSTVASIVLGVGGTALALYSEQAVSNLGTIRAGDLNLTLDELAWRQVTPGVSPGASGTATTVPDGFRSMPGDVFEIRVPANTVLQGENLIAELTIDYQAGSLGEAVSATYRVEDPSGAQVAPASGQAAVGTTVSIDGLLGSNPGVTTRFTIVVTVEVLGEYRWVTPATQGGAVSWSAGVVNAALKQVRPGGGA